MPRQREGIWLWVKTVLELFGVGEFTTHFEPILVVGLGCSLVYAGNIPPTTLFQVGEIARGSSLPAAELGRQIEPRSPAMEVEVLSRVRTSLVVGGGGSPWEDAWTHTPSSEMGGGHW